MLQRLSGAPSRFFNITPIGRILNRFTSDIGQLQPSMLRSLRTSGTLNCHISFSVIISVMPSLAPLVISIAWLYIRLAPFYHYECFYQGLTFVVVLMMMLFTVGSSILSWLGPLATNPERMQRFPMESTSMEHMMSQLTKTIKVALKSTEEERAMLRAPSTWRQRMEDFHERSINISRHVAGPSAWRPSDANFNPTTHAQESSGWEPEYQAYPSQPDCDSRSIAESHSPRFSLSPASPGSPGQWSQESLSPGGDPHLIATPCLIPHGRRGSVGTDISENEGDYFSHSPNSPRETRQNFGNFLEHANKTTARDQKHAPDPFLDAAPTRPFGAHSRVSSVESIVSIVDEKQNSPLNKRSLRGVASEFVQKLQMLNAHNSKHELSIKKYLMKSEEAFFDKVKKDKLSSAASIRLSQRYSVWGTPVASTFDHSRPSSPSNTSFAASGMNLSDEYSGPLPNSDGVVIMTGLPIALFQITLLSGQNSQSDLQLYVLGGVFLASSVVWYTLFRMKPSVYVLSAPWVFFALAFFLIGLPSVTAKLNIAHVSLSSAATWAYAVASAAAFCFFGLNFGEEAGAATEVLDVTCDILAPWWIVLIVWPLAVMSLLFAYLMLYGLPHYYRQTPPKVPNFLRTLSRRKIVLWFLGSEILRDHWLSGPYGRNWSFLWNVPISKWQIAVLVVAFFIFVWAIMMGILTWLSKTHTWLLPVFTVGLGAPRWCQMLALTIHPMGSPRGTIS
ncbi:hypothetical protein BD311DRAFT_822659 [Dichomitus squalens]|uniref:Cell wall alpha-1,3-glucan synthase Mok11-14/Ags1-like transmembrane domain-containing protein n=1 Tax=Dichomitus squalens TaxID=114155 RepID=A0A4Q9M6R1_9APHY|nr:hypothetical protein BD311DRAFT_822659 [Dichomitus squalens]